MEMDTKWDFKEFFDSDKSFLDALEFYKKNVEILINNLEELSLEQKLKEYYELSFQSEKLVSYAELHSDLDVSNELYLQYKNQAYLEKSKLEPIRNKIDNEILKISISLEEYLKEYPSMKAYGMHLYNVLRLKEHTIGSSAIQNENVLIAQVNSLYNTILNVEMPVEEVEIQGEKIKANIKNYNTELRSL